MGSACARSKKKLDVALDVLGEAIRRVPAKSYVAASTSALASTGRGAQSPCREGRLEARRKARQGREEACEAGHDAAQGDDEFALTATAHSPARAAAPTEST